MITVVRNTTRVLRGMILIRPLLVLLGAIVVVARWPSLLPTPDPGAPLHMLFFLPTIVTWMFFVISRLEKLLGRFYLPIGLALAVIDFSFQYAIAYLRPDRLGFVQVMLPGREINFFWASTEIILLVVLPCMLAGAAYGLRGAVMTTSLAAIIHLGLGVGIWLSDLPLGGFVVLLPVRLAVLYVFPMLTGAMADIWRREHQQLQQANRQLRGYAATIEHLATSRERVRLARAMHDTLAHSLSALTVQLEALDTLQETNPQAVQTQLTKIRQHARSGLNEARLAIQDLRSEPVEELGLPAAMEQMAAQFGPQNGVTVEWSLCGEPFPLLPVQANTLYRIAEEALENVARHAAASQVEMQLDYEEGVTVSVRDNGLGFDPQTVEADRYGLVGIYEHAALIDGRVTVDTAPGKGTRLTVHIAEPWKA